ncbi:MAG: hypothetical protein Q9N34_06940 [Aquificota bacterium]|nr:hypothetical protein [Aquificota bacterium]
MAEEIDRTIEKIKNFPEEVLETVGRLKDLIEEFHKIAIIKMVKLMKSSEEGKRIPAGNGKGIRIYMHSSLSTV